MKAPRFVSSPLFLSLLSVLLLSIAWWGFAPTVLVGWVPLLMLKKRMDERKQRGFVWWAAFTILMWHLFTTYWVSYATLLAAPTILIGCTVMLLPAWILYHLISRRSTKVLSYTILVAAWVVCEWWVALGDVSFPWVALGSAWGDSPAIVQWYSIFGQSGGTLWVMLVNIFTFEALSSRKARKWAFAVLHIPIFTSLAMYYNYDEPQETMEVAVIQPNVDAYEKFSSVGAWEQTLNIIELAQSAPSATELYVAPETAIVMTVNLTELEQNRDVVAIQDFLRAHSPHATFVVGASAADRQGYYNSALYITTSSVEPYHKRKLVLGVEIVPEWARFFADAVDMGGYVGSLGRSDSAVVRDGVGAAICYESIYSTHFAEWVQSGAELMAIITNDGWWGDTHGYRQHFDFARLRALETRRSIARSANTGISGFITPRGDVIEQLGWDERGVLTASLALNKEQSVYVRWGDIVTRMSFFVLGLSLLYFISLAYRRKS